VRSGLSLTRTEEYKSQMELKIICSPVVVSVNRQIFRNTAILITWMSSNQFTRTIPIQDLH
jgi:hypothetical protein